MYRKSIEIKWITTIINYEYRITKFFYLFKSRCNNTVSLFNYVTGIIALFN